MAFERPKHDLADIVRAHRPELERRHRLSRPQKRVLTAIARCRTAALGGHLEVCPCGFERPAYDSCRNRHCPKCQAAAQQRWIDARAARILDLGHFHLVFTLPAELRGLALRHPVEVHAALFDAVRDLLLGLGETRLGARLGLTMVLHTWTRELAYHPHLHVLATAGGLSLDGTRFVRVRKPFLFPVKVMGALLRGKVLDALRRLQGAGAFPELGPRAFDRLMGGLAARRRWVVYAKAPFRRSTHVLAYLGRYTHRVGLANSRLVEVGEDRVTFRTKEGKTAALHPVELLRRFVQHVLPDGFHKIRHAGLYAAPQALAQARALLPAPKSAPQAPAPAPAQDTCPRCGGPLQRLPLAALPRSPPRDAA